MIYLFVSIHKTLEFMCAITVSWNAYFILLWWKTKQNKVKARVIFKHQILTLVKMFMTGVSLKKMVLFENRPFHIWLIYSIK